MIFISKGYGYLSLLVFFPIHVFAQINGVNISGSPPLCSSGEQLQAAHNSGTQLSDFGIGEDYLSSASNVIGDFTSASSSFISGIPRTFCSVTGAWSETSVTLTANRVSGSDCTATNQSTIYTFSLSCEQPGCDVEVGDEYIVPVFDLSSGSPPLTHCQENCEFLSVRKHGIYGTCSAGSPDSCSTGSELWVYQSTGLLCEVPPEPEIALIEHDGTAQVSADNTTLQPEPDSQCGHVGGEYTCIPKNYPNANECLTTPSGAIVCGGGASSQSRPNVNNTPIPPDSVILTSDAQTLALIQHWDRTTTDNVMTNDPPPQQTPPAPESNTPPPPNPPAPNAPPTPAESDGDGEGDGGGGGPCDPEVEQCDDPDPDPDCDPEVEECGPGDGGDCDPEIEECGDGGGGGGTASSSCSNEPDCTDVGHVQCAILRQVWTSNCKTFAFEDGNTPAAAAQLVASVGLNDGITTAEQAAADDLKTEVDVSSWISEFLPQYSGDTCPAPMTFTALGETVEFKFDFICDFLSIMSFFVIFSSTIGAFRIAFAS